MPVELDKQVYDNTRDINNIALNVVKLTTLMEGAEKRYIDDHQNFKDAIKNISKLHEQIQSVMVLDKDIAAVKELYLEQKAEIGTLRHDVRNVQNSQGGYTVILEKISNITSDIAGLTEITKAQGESVKSLQSARDRVIGGAEVIGFGGKIFWTLFGGTIISGMLYGIVWLFDKLSLHKDAVDGAISGF